ncbi:family 76 glycoside hydrolase [Microdochium trichocladiopsis]|uniref:Mannan endo-1,6-alpha-mannosidase n=1 Tax=Microdochium trichocladiopsis TaxID=1682393 RepID=A0A9P9BTN1_9PEZI|nr:family 76 glycoside hydrolase [Microdochium trichocladiopsis]KAH7030634.1 family 76 glycoside hydrolase [Microdochium trichocladiopsis]
MLARAWKWIAAASAVAQIASAALPDVDLDDNDSIAAVAKIVAQDMMSFYPPYGGSAPGWTIGILPGPPPEPSVKGQYFWWQAGAMWGTLLDYRHQTGDDSFDQWITQAMLAQVGEQLDFNPRNWSLSMGNDDQAPPEDQPQWLALAQGTLHSQMNMNRRIDPNANTPCAWGLRWQVFSGNTGYDYINTISNGCFMNMAVRVGRYTGNSSYYEWAEKTYDFMRGLKYISDDYQVFDGAHEPHQCRDINNLTFSYNAAIVLQSAAYMYNVTDGAEKWKREIDGILNRTIISFFGDTGVPLERNCELVAEEGCNTDMRSFKGYLHRWLASTMKMAPYTEPTIMPLLRSSLRAALKTCTGGANGRMCGFHWREGRFIAGPGKADDVPGVSEQMNVLGALLSVMRTESVRPPLTNATGGTSGGDYNAGTNGDYDPYDRFRPVTTADRAGAGVATAVFVGVFAGMMAWLNWDQMRGGGAGLFPVT